ncbi:MAG: hypothetical protein WD335_02820 [Candidatus Paceibacterota bacterium]
MSKQATKNEIEESADYTSGEIKRYVAFLVSWIVALFIDLHIYSIFSSNFPASGSGLQGISRAFHVFYISAAITLILMGISRIVYGRKCIKESWK